MDLPAQPEQREQLALQDRLVQPELPEQVELQAQLAQPELRVQPVIKVPQVQQDLLGRLGIQVQVVPQVQRVILGVVVLQVQPELLDLQDLVVHLDLQELPEDQVQLVQLALRE